MNDLSKRILDFWFGNVDETGRDTRWFQSTPEFDAHIRDAFGQALTAVGNGAFQRWSAHARSWLAYILLTDQFPRNVHRGEARAFQFDGLALDMAKRGIARGLDRQLGIIERSFAYMPLEHSESLHDQQTCVALFRQLVESASEPDTANAQSSLDYAEQHREIIARFGRFPHRNDVLGRAHTREELAYLKTANRFGQ